MAESDEAASLRSWKPHFCKLIEHHIDDMIAVAEMVVEADGHAVLQAGAADGLLQGGHQLVLTGGAGLEGGGVLLPRAWYGPWLLISWICGIFSSSIMSNLLHFVDLAAGLVQVQQALGPGDHGLVDHLALEAGHAAAPGVGLGDGVHNGPGLVQVLLGWA